MHENTIKETNTNIWLIAFSDILSIQKNTEKAYIVCDFNIHAVDQSDSENVSSFRTGFSNCAFFPDL